MHLALRSKSIKKRLYDKVGASYPCDACGNKTPWFVCILATEKPATYHTICIDCYEAKTWQAKVAQKETTTKDHSLNGYRNLASRRRGNLSVERWEANIQATSYGESKKPRW